MRKFIYLPRCFIALCLIPGLLGGCVEGMSVEEFNNETDIGLVIGSGYHFRYDEKNCQTGYNESRNEFWVMDDNMANYFILKCDAFPDVGNTVKADLTYTTSNDIKTRTGLEFRVTDADSTTGKIWLWCKPKKIGAIVKVLR